ncbi:MAG: hypothetical protein COW13_05175 [Candidatus Omnitrophica bacterium CG12_big_fil_rev_8_21_14_0_65_50_5]|nr:MAG: hypothetical protein COW13_05175 [Candidatus Omnitrophica bacterium CG12_big_fil_rev_8_21_14_0_65_50_5]
MPKFKMPPYHKQGIVVQMVPLIDVMLFTLILFMYISVFSQTEANLDISVPQSTSSSREMENPGEIVINVAKDGRIFVNDRQMGGEQLGETLKDAVALFPNQQVIIRADENSYHKFIVTVLDACARANIWNVSFATVHAEL